MTKNILIIAAECDEIDGLAAYLEDRGFAAEVVSEETEALMVFQQRPCDIVLVDLDLPGLVVPDFVEAILSAQPSTRIIVLLGTEMPSVLNRAVQSGVCCYARKPFDKERLVLQMQKL